MGPTSLMLIDAGTANLCYDVLLVTESRLSDREVTNASHFHQPFEPGSADCQRR